MGIWNRITGSADRDKFIAEAVARMRSLHGDAAFDATSFSVRGGDHTMFLDNLWAEYQRANRRERPAVLDRYLTRTTELAMPLPETFEAVRQRLRPMVHDPIYWSVSKLKLRSIDLDEDALPTVRPFGRHLTISVVVDRPDSMRSVGDSDRVAWGRDFDALLDEALRNLEQASRAKWPLERPGVFRAPFDDGYAVSRLALPRLITGLAVRGAPVVLALNAGIVFVTGADDVAGLVALAELGEQGFELPKPMSPIPLTLDGDTWVEHRLPDGHPAKPAFDLLRYRSLIGNYEHQQEQLKALPGAGDGPFIASYRAMQKQGGPIRSIATLTIGVWSSLPVADHVVVMLPDATYENYEMMADVPWDTFARIVPLEPVPDLVPPRFLATGDVDAAQRAALIAASVA